MTTLEKINQSFAAFSAAARLDDGDGLTQLMDAVVGSGQAGPGGAYERLFLLLADLIEARDKREPSLPETTPVQALRFLMEQHGLSQSQLPEVGNQSVVSQVLAEQRQLNVRQIARLCQRFGVGPSLFIAKDETLH
ncbi:MAG: transcriptional regulator [Pseudomonadota bacterium]|nr:transcriptional regulator [Pseudomonadota bacterium]